MADFSGDACRLIAFYLPQFHPIPENDEWWGKGFTEWRNVAQARPRFRGHYQPHIPADLGFYDLRLPEVRQAQADLAREYGLSGFCYYHYWFNGRRLLDRPFSEVLQSGKPDFPFCLCWANENWTRAWDGNDRQVLIGQNCSESGDREHMRRLVNAFKDPRYIRVGGKPLFLVYRARQLPDPRRTAEVWREEAAAQGIGEIMLAFVEAWNDEGGDPSLIGFDAAVEFQPRWRLLPKPLIYRVLRKLGLQPDWKIDYPRLVRTMLDAPPPSYKRYPCVTPMWDNSSRRRRGAHIVTNSSPEHYERWLTEVLMRTRRQAVSDRIMFVNAWNEWAEGCHLEPCHRWGGAYLEATHRALVSAGESEASHEIIRGAVAQER